MSPLLGAHRAGSRAMPRAGRFASLILSAAFLVLAACSASRSVSVDPVSADAFESQVWPILRDNCLGCHGAFYELGGLRLEDAEGIRAGSKSGPVIAPGDSSASELYRRVSLPEEHTDRMPQKARRLAPEQIESIRSWIDSGADFGDWTGDD